MVANTRTRSQGGGKQSDISGGVALLGEVGVLLVSVNSYHKEEAKDTHKKNIVHRLVASTPSNSIPQGPGRSLSGNHHSGSTQPSMITLVVHIIDNFVHYSIPQVFLYIK